MPPESLPLLRFHPTNLIKHLTLAGKSGTSPVCWEPCYYPALTMAKKIRDNSKGHTTHWATQFLVAAELTRRGYTVSLTMGNHTPVADLMVGASNGKQFWVDVKGLSSNNAWLVNIKPDRLNLYYILVRLAPLATHPKVRQPDRFFILTQAEANALVRNYAATHPNDKGKRPGFGFKDSQSAEDAWHKLPT